MDKDRGFVCPIFLACYKTASEPGAGTAQALEVAEHLYSQRSPSFSERNRMARSGPVSPSAGPTVTVTVIPAFVAVKSLAAVRPGTSGRQAAPSEMGPTNAAKRCPLDPPRRPEEKRGRTYPLT